VTLGDVDGDGVSDVVQAAHAAPSRIRFGLGPVADLLVRATTALGERSVAVYRPSTEFDHASPSGIETLPTVLQLPTELTRHDGRGSDFTTTYDYTGGRLGDDGGFQGFARVDAVDARGVTERTHTHQDDPLVGYPVSVEVIDTDGTLRARRSSAYNLVHPFGPSGGVTQIQVIQSDAETFDAGGSRHTRIETAYDEFLNAVEIVKHGDLAIVGDEGRTVFEYTGDLASGIVDAPVRILVYDAADSLVGESILLYDGLPEGAVDAGNATSVIDAVEIGGAQVSRSVPYDVYGNVLTTADRNGAVTEFAYDAVRHSFRVRATDPLGRIVESHFDPRFGTAVSDIDANGHETTRELDAFGREVRETRPGDEGSPFGTRTMVYSDLGNATAQSVRVLLTETPGAPDTFDTQMWFDGMGQVYRIESEGDGGRSVVVETGFDDAGKARSISYPHFVGDPAPVTTFERDALRRSLRTTEPDGTPHVIEYAGAQSEVVYRLGNRTTFLRDGHDNILEVRQRIGGEEHVTRYAYNHAGSPIEVVNALGETTRIEYDALGRRVALDDPASGPLRYVYDDVGNLLEQIDAAGQRIRLTYNAGGELVRKELDSGEVMSFEYGTDAASNGNGRLVHVEDSAGSLDIEYDARGSVSARRRTLPSGSRSFSTAFDYDSMDRIQRVTYPDGFLAEYAYGPSGYAESIVDGTGQVIVEGMRYTAAGRLAGLVHGNGVDSSYAYDALSRLSDLTAVAPDGVALQDLSYAYDALGNVLEIADHTNSARTQTFAYDEAGRIVRATGSYGEEIYEYDALGSLLRKGDLLYGLDPMQPQRALCGIDLGLLDSPSNGIDGNPNLSACMDLLLAQESPTSGAARAMLEDPRSRGVANNPNIGDSFAALYDEVGNVIAKNGERFVYDTENRLLRIEGAHGQLVEANIYDATGQRVLQTTRDGTTILIEGLYEQTRSSSARHVRVGGMLVATIVTPGRRGQPALAGGAGERALVSLARRPGGPGVLAFGLGLLVLLVALTWAAGARWRHGRCRLARQLGPSTTTPTTSATRAS
jgi:YD repeat-containing protein